VWREYYRRAAHRSRLVGIGFTLDGARLFDERGDSTVVTPSDVEEWRTTLTNAAPLAS
jgi:hypothetical protein